MLEEVTPLILTYNEAPNILRALAPLDWARQIVVIDSGSTDGTLEILQRHSNVRIVHRRFDDHTSQWNFGLAQISTSWVLSLDADYILTKAFSEELRALRPTGRIAAYVAGFRYLIFGKPLRGTLYPDRAVLFRRQACHYVADGHTQRLQTQGTVHRLTRTIDHDDRKPLSRWLDSQRAYALLEADVLAAANPKSLGWADRLRRSIWPAAPAAFLYTMFLKGCLFDGWHGWFYALQRTYAELLLSLELLDRRLKGMANKSAIDV
jgi:glycosyltransferase involved in cell wall biosynthesis